MPALTLAVELSTLSLALWLGLYLIARNPTKGRLRYTGLGLAAYALALAMLMLSKWAEDPNLSSGLLRLYRLLILLPTLLWTGAMITLLPEDHDLRGRLNRIWGYAILPISLLCYLIGASTGLVIGFTDGGIRPAYFVFAAITLAPLVGMLILTLLNLPDRSKRTTGIVLICTIFFGLEMVVFLFPLISISPTILSLAIGGDLIFMGCGIALLDAFDEGQTLLPDMVRSFDGAFLTSMIFGGQVVIVMFLSTGITFTMVLLLLTTITAAIILQVLSNPLQSLVDRIAFRGRDALSESRDQLRVSASVLPRLPDSLDLNAFDEKEFARLTRRALSYFGDLPRLASSPLTRLSLIDERLSERGIDGDTLERAAELKRLLTESIDRLKPPGDASFGTSDEWRYYNALYFPYIAGMKPYSRRADYSTLEADDRDILDWFQLYVPERTLYNWQTAAARLIAQDIREKVGANGS